MYNLYSITAALLLIVGIPFIIGAEHSYTCTVARVYDLTDDGMLRTSTWEKDMRGSQFSISRHNGEIIGKVLPTQNAKSVRVVNKGTNENSFKAVADFGDQYQLIEIQEFKSGNFKPFVASSMGGAGIVTGTCK